MLAFYIYIVNSYFAESVATGAGVAAGAACLVASGVVGTVVVGTVVSSSPNTLEPDAAPLKLKLESKINAIKIPPNVQVLLARKSVVF